MNALFNKIEVTTIRSGQPVAYADNETVSRVTFDAIRAYRHTDDEFLIGLALKELGYENLRRGMELGSPGMRFSAYIDYANVSVARDLNSTWRQYWVEVRMVVPSTE